ncbi:MAG: GNAT family N-acetyltransferase [Acidimicrobiia bacterium]|nr:GNAT family N-acetyltransferase [Acidimicrobiia bacterium]
MVTRHEYVRALTDLPKPESLRPELTVRQVMEADREGLASLMLEAYRGTIDYDGETIVEARDEIESSFDGDQLLDASFVVEDDDVVVSAILVRRWEGTVLIGYVMTLPDYKGQGLAAALVRMTLSRLAAAGETDVHAFITAGNFPSERVFLAAGFVRRP